MRGLRVQYFERLLFANETLAVATHRLPADDPDFECHGPASGFLFARTTSNPRSIAVLKSGPVSSLVTSTTTGLETA